MSAKLRFDDARHAQPLFAGACVELWAKVVLRGEPSPERRGRSRSFGDRVRVPAGAWARGGKLCRPHWRVESDGGAGILPAVSTLAEIEKAIEALPPEQWAKSAAGWAAMRPGRGTERRSGPCRWSPPRAGRSRSGRSTTRSMPTDALLDVNVLIAAVFEDHIAHEKARRFVGRWGASPRRRRRRAVSCGLRHARGRMRKSGNNPRA